MVKGFHEKSPKLSAAWGLRAVRRRLDQRQSRLEDTDAGKSSARRITSRGSCLGTRPWALQEVWAASSGASLHPRAPKDRTPCMYPNQGASLNFTQHKFVSFNQSKITRNKEQWPVFTTSSRWLFRSGKEHLTKRQQMQQPNADEVPGWSCCFRHFLKDQECEQRS